MELSVIELNLSILKWNPGHLDRIYANSCENLHHFSRIYYITDLLILQSFKAMQVVCGIVCN